MKKLLILVSALQLIACNGGGGAGGDGSGGGGGNKDDSLPPNLQTYSYVANMNKSISVCKMTLNGLYRSPCASYTNNVLPNGYAILVNNSNTQVFLTGNTASSKGNWQNCQINPVDGGLTCDPYSAFTNIVSPDSMVSYYPNNTASDGTGKVYIIDSGSGASTNLYICNITNQDKLAGNTCTLLAPLNIGVSYGLAITYGQGQAYLYVSTTGQKVYRYNINSDYTVSNPTIISNINPFLMSSAGKMVANPLKNYLYVSNTNINSIAEYSIPNGNNATATSTVFSENDGIAINTLYGNSSIPPENQANNAFIYVTNHGNNQETPYISKCPINGDGTLSKCDKLGSGFNSPYAIAISGPIVAPSQ